MGGWDKGRRQVGIHLSHGNFLPENFTEQNVAIGWVFQQVGISHKALIIFPDYQICKNYMVLGSKWLTKKILPPENFIQTDGPLQPLQYD